MSVEEKKKNPSCETRGGYLKKISYKEAWAKCPAEVLAQIKNLPNFNAKVFEEISGIKLGKEKGDK